MLRIRGAVLFVAALVLGAGLAAADLEPGLHIAVHESFGLPEPVIVRLVDSGLPDEELPVVGLIASRADVEPVAIVRLREGGMSYLEIAERYDLGPEVFYVPFERDPGPPYGKAWGFYAETPRSEWRSIRLSDDQIVHLANVRLLADHYQVTPTRVVELHRDADGYGAIHRELGGSKGKGKTMGHGKSKDHPPGHVRGVDRGEGKEKARAKGDPPR